jgi:hypothetical protein
MERIDKVIVSHRAALQHKHGQAGLRRIEQAVARLVRADAARGLGTKLVYLDRAADMQSIGKPVKKATNRQRAKRAIDDVCHSLQPDYLMILGAPDVVPHQRLRNPMAAARDPDRFIDSDLPYACEVPYDTSIRSFLGPTRVLGRLPDVPAKGDTTYLTRLLSAASAWRSRPRLDYERFFALSTESWKSSTRTSARKIFGTQHGVRLSPTEGPAWSKADLAGRLHFINCHGDTAKPEFYGEAEDDENDQPIAHLSTQLPKRVRPATIVAAECCYGAELYAPRRNEPLPICSTYLAEGAWAFYGSTTVAYGPAEGNNFADLMCVKFLQAILDGASLGRAALLAQQHYVAVGGYMEMIDLKTLAQFVLLGDPSIHPVRSAASPKAKSRGRRTRRKQLSRKGSRLAVTTASVGSRPDAKVSPTMLRRLHELSGERPKKVVSFRLHAPPQRVTATTGRRLAASETLFHAVVLKGKAARNARVAPVRLLIVRDVNGKIERVAEAVRHS